MCKMQDRTNLDDPRSNLRLVLSEKLTISGVDAVVATTQTVDRQVGAQFLVLAHVGDQVARLPQTDRNLLGRARPRPSGRLVPAQRPVLLATLLWRRQVRHQRVRVSLELQASIQRLSNLEVFYGSL